MSIKIRLFTNRIGLGLILITALALALAACATDDEPASSKTGGSTGSSSSNGASPPTLESESSLLSDENVILTATPIAGPPEIAVTPKEQPEAGSDEEEVLNVLEKQVRALNNSDWNGFSELCHPKFLNPPKEAVIKHMWEELGGDFGYFISGFTTAGYNARNVEVTIHGDAVAVAKFEMYNYDDFVSDNISRSWGKYEGVWYQDGGFSCTTDFALKDGFEDK